MTSDSGRELLSNTARVNGTTIHYVRAGEGPPLILIHGFPQDWHEYHAIMPRLARRFTVIAIDLRGIGESAVTLGGYDAANLAEDVYQLASALKLERIYLVGHDIGGHVAYAFVRRYPQMLQGAMILDTAIPGIDGWDEILGSPALWHVHFMQVPELPEKLIISRPADYLGYFFKFGKFTPSDVSYALKAHSTPEQLRAALEIYRAFPANARFNEAQRDRNDVPLFFSSGDGSPFARLIPRIAAGLRSHGLTHVETGVIAGSAHYVVQDQPDATAELIERHASRHLQ